MIPNRDALDKFIDSFYEKDPTSVPSLDGLDEQRRKLAAGRQAVKDFFNSSKSTNIPKGTGPIKLMTPIGCTTIWSDLPYTPRWILFGLVELCMDRGMVATLITPDPMYEDYHYGIRVFSATGWCVAHVYYRDSGLILFTKTKDENPQYAEHDRAFDLADPSSFQHVVNYLSELKPSKIDYGK